MMLCREKSKGRVMSKGRRQLTDASPSYIKVMLPVVLLRSMAPQPMHTPPLQNLPNLSEGPQHGHGNSEVTQLISTGAGL